jgi:FXSXX-COOH protein
MILHDQSLKSAIPDLRDIPLERLSQLGDSVLANSIDLYLRRLQDTRVPLNAFNSNIG